MTRTEPSLLGWLETIRGLRAHTEEELFHFTFKKLSRLGLNGRQAVLVDQHCLMLQPARPSLLRDILEYAFAQIAGISRAVEARGFGFQNYAVHITRHSDYSDTNLGGARECLEQCLDRCRQSDPGRIAGVIPKGGGCIHD